MKTFQAMLATGAMLVCGLAQAVLPASGLYWNSDNSGLGYYIEVQGTALVMLAYAHDKETGAPLFYLASGEVQPDPERDELAYKFEGPLYRFDFGPCITCNWGLWDTSEYAQHVGEISLFFLNHNHVAMTVTADNGITKSVSLKRFRFGRTIYSLPIIATDQIQYQYLSDLRGDWVFVDKSVGNTVVWSFSFNTAEHPVTFAGSIFGHDYSSAESVVFRDESRNAALVCTSQACGLIQDGTTLASFHYTDIAQASMFGYRTPTDPEAEYETGHHVVGVRVPDLTPDIPAPETAQ